jgi:hypothetical protein
MNIIFGRFFPIAAILLLLSQPCSIDSADAEPAMKPSVLRNSLLDWFFILIPFVRLCTDFIFMSYNKRGERICPMFRIHPKISFYYDRLQSLWIGVVGEKGSRCALARLRAFSTSSLVHRLFARSRYKTGFGMNSSISVEDYVLIV